ncbi:uncharacterized protein LOC130049289 [Ostrea edulis]|uniref:uncharacterized protein LOC130049289 n=2 Tax=Ostrea edulis TaxID=37623 RepID=UPI0024AF640B|nr:uncharacterized protein LOC130049289 [Ostrea edulis]
MLAIVIVIAVRINRMTKRLDVEIKQIEARIQRELLNITCMLLHRELQRMVRRRLRQRSTRYQSIAEDHYELTPIVNDPYEPPLRRSATLAETEYQYVAPYETPKEGCFCRYCLDQAANHPPNSLPEVDGAHGTARAYDSLQGIFAEKPFLDRTTSEKHSQYSLLNNPPDVYSLSGKTRALIHNDHSQSTERRLSRRRMRRGRKSGLNDYDDDGINGNWIELERIKQRQEEAEDAEFISQLLSDVKREPITDVLPGISPFKIPKTLPNYKREEAKESIALSEFSFLELEIQEVDDAINANYTEKEKPSFKNETLSDAGTTKTTNDAPNELFSSSNIKSKAEENNVAPTKGVCIAEVNFDVGNSGGESNSSDYLKPMPHKNTGDNSSEKQTSLTTEFCLAEVNFDVEDNEGDSESEQYGKENGSNEKQIIDIAGLCIAEVNFDVQNIEALNVSPNNTQPMADRDNKEDNMSIAFSTGLCIAEINFDIENTEKVSDSSDYLEPIELDSGTHTLQDEKTDIETYETLQNVTDTMVNIPNIETANEYSIQGEDAGFNICLADLNNFQDILSEVEYMEESILDIGYSSSKEYERLRTSTEIVMNAPEEKHREETTVMSADTGLNVCFAELQNFEQLLLESETVEETASDKSHESHYDTIKIDVDVNHSDDSDTISE